MDCPSQEQGGRVGQLIAPARAQLCRLLYGAMGAMLQATACRQILMSVAVVYNGPLTTLVSLCLQVRVATVVVATSSRVATAEVATVVATKPSHRRWHAGFGWLR